MSPPFLLTSSEVDILTLVTQKRSPERLSREAGGTQSPRLSVPTAGTEAQAGWATGDPKVEGGFGVASRAERMGGSGVGRH